MKISYLTSHSRYNVFTTLAERHRNGNIPGKGEQVVLDGNTYIVISVVWDEDINARTREQDPEIKVYLEQI